VSLRTRVVLELVLVGLAAFFALAPLPPSLIENWFSTGLYPAVQGVLTPVSNLVPFAILDLLLVGALVAVVLALIRAVRSARRDHRLMPIVQLARGLLVAASIVYLVFLAAWGFNYRRVPMGQRLVVASEAPTGDAVVGLGLEAARRINGLYAEAHRLGWPNDEWRSDAMRQAFAEVQRMLTDAPLARPGRLKSSLLGPYFRWTSVDGMVDPFALEVLANPDLLPFERPFVAAHEWSHLAGYAHEAEANFVGWLTCIRADVPGQYSGWLYLFWQVNSEVDGDGRAQLAKAIDAGPRSDIEAIIGRLQRAQLPWLRNAGWALYDRYLRANRVEGGVRSYGAVVSLILQTKFDDGWTPVRREGAGPPSRD
jgi:hypothetical protein